MNPETIIANLGMMILFGIFFIIIIHFISFLLQPSSKSPSGNAIDIYSGGEYIKTSFRKFSSQSFIFIIYFTILDIMTLFLMVFLSKLEYSHILTSPVVLFIAFMFNIHVIIIFLLFKIEF